MDAGERAKWSTLTQAYILALTWLPFIYSFILVLNIPFNYYHFFLFQLCVAALGNPCSNILVPVDLCSFNCVRC